ncbi:fatty acid cis/trans isomerase [Vibrio sonorensis]|uniref:fatty acid cis/trans isomerase n=1 Tax=Vibrio sonorensis TaxID=1004316 RepID=UPI0008DA8C55|nr:fatty acid cis/trans isomerase [Vibrio sonorensis]
MSSLKRILFTFVIVTFAGCATYATYNYDQLFGQQQVRNRVATPEDLSAIDYLNDVKPIIDNRCVVCHACYDAPCQLKLTSPDGLDRGASNQLVYQGTRLVASSPTRLFEDALTTQDWRAKGFHPVLNERDQTVEANLHAGLVARMLMQKQHMPLIHREQLNEFDFSIDREQTCPTIEEFDDYETKNPLWGMPFGLPALNEKEHSTLMTWLERGAKHPQPQPLTTLELKNVHHFEHFLNQDSLKHQLSARYIYEHLFLNHLYFKAKGNTKRYFQLVRSTTPPGETVHRISTRRPYDDPKVSRVYYRLIPLVSTIVDKTHMPYALNQARLLRWKELFITPDYTVTSLPSYRSDVAANPMTAFFDLPVSSRYKFMLDNAQSTIMSFIKGPVCRGQLALNVINDRFWVFFVDPDKADIPSINRFYQQQADNLKLPGELESNTLPITNWVSYSRQQARFLEAKSEFTNNFFKDGEHLTADVIWHGGGENPNAALTVFRHFDSASVVQGLVGKPPKTSWVLDYALLERIHYLLVAGFDVYGNFGHQLITRMFMDFLRMEGESNFVSLLPSHVRHNEMASWYKDQSPQLSQFLQRNVQPFNQPTRVPYQTTDYKNELYQILKTQLQPVLNRRYQIENTSLTVQNEALLQSVDQIRGQGLYYLPQILVLLVESESGTDEVFTLLHNNAHTNISSLFDEENNRDPNNDDLTLVRGIVGSYPAALLKLSESQIKDFIQSLQTIQKEADYIALLDMYGIRRHDSQFWKFSDRIHNWYQKDQPVEYGLLDYNRLENR